MSTLFDKQLQAITEDTPEPDGDSVQPADRQRTQKHRHHPEEGTSGKQRERGSTTSPQRYRASTPQPSARLTANNAILSPANDRNLTQFGNLRQIYNMEGPRLVFKGTPTRLLDFLGKRNIQATYQWARDNLMLAIPRNQYRATKAFIDANYHKQGKVHVPISEVFGE